MKFSSQVTLAGFLLFFGLLVSSDAFNCEGIARLRVNVWSYTQCSESLTLHFENLQVYSPNQKKSIDVEMGPGIAARGPVNTVCRRQASWVGEVNYGYSWERSPAYPTSSALTAMSESRWRLTRMSRNGEPVTEGGRTLRFRQERDLFITNEGNRLSDGACIDGDSHVACFVLEYFEFPLLSLTGRCILRNGRTCLPDPPRLCGSGCNSNICPLEF